jgi:hypothetical protein
MGLLRRRGSFLDNRRTDGGEVVSFMSRPQGHSAAGLKNPMASSGIETAIFRACRIVPQQKRIYICN